MRKLNYLLTIGIGVLIFAMGSCKKDTTSTVTVTGVTLNTTSTGVNVGGNVVLTATLTPGNATNMSVKWTSSNNNVATVNNAGVVIGVAYGTDTITATTVDQNKKAKCIIFVNNKNLSGTLTKSLTLLKDSTYFLVGNLTLSKGDTLTIMPGVKVQSTGNFSFNIVGGDFVCIGTNADPILLTTSFASPVVGFGYWGGIQADSLSNVTIKFTHINWTGGPAADGSTQATVDVEGTQMTDYHKYLIVEDSWFYASVDDGIHPAGQIHCSIKRNVFQHMGGPDGETINIKKGAQGDVSYNYIWSAANNSIKLNTGSNLPETSWNIYNNTIINGGWRKVGEFTEGILIDDAAKANIYNNILIGCRNGINITSKSDYANIKEGNNLVYMIGFDPDTLNTNQNPYPGQIIANSTDIVDSLAACNTVITHYDFESAKQDIEANIFGTDFNVPSLLASSPAKGKGTTSAITSFYSTSIPGASQDVLDIDMGAYPTDGKGNTHMPTSAFGSK